MGNSESEEKPKSKFNFFKEEKEESDYKKITDDIKESCKCSMKTRLIGFGICSLIGWGLEILAVVSYIINGDIMRFAILFSIGQVINILAYMYHNSVPSFWLDPFVRRRI